MMLRRAGKRLQRGAALVEMAVLISLLVVVAAVGARSLGQKQEEKWCEINGVYGAEENLAPGQDYSHFNLPGFRCRVFWKAQGRGVVLW